MQQPLKLQCKDQVLDFECTSATELNGRLVRSESQRAWLRDHDQREADTDSPWYLDSDGERLPVAELFSRSPWSLLVRTGSIKILMRFQDIDTGKARFDLPDQYEGESFRWLRESAMGKPPDIR